MADTKPVEAVHIVLDENAPNPDEFASGRVVIAALDTPIQLPDIDVAPGMKVFIKGSPGNLGTLYHGPSRNAASNVNQASSLIPNENRSLNVSNVNAIWVCAITNANGFVGDALEFEVEVTGRNG